MLEESLEESNLLVSNRELRQFSAIWLGLFLGLALWRGVFAHNTLLIVVYAGTALAIGPAGFFRPSIIRPVFLALKAITLPLNKLGSRVTLGAIFYLVITPIGLVFRLIGRDALCLKRNPRRNSYWIECPDMSNLRKYFRQS